LHDTFPPGTAIYETTTTGPISALAAKHRVLLVSQSSGALTVDVDRSQVHMSPYADVVVNS